MSNADTIGMMNKAYTVPRHEILSWLNEQFDVTNILIILADINKSRATWNWCGLLPDIRLCLPRRCSNV